MKKETKEILTKQKKARIIGWIIRGVLIVGIILYMIFKN